MNKVFIFWNLPGPMWEKSLPGVAGLTPTENKAEQCLKNSRPKEKQKTCLTFAKAHAGDPFWNIICLPMSNFS